MDKSKPEREQGQRIRQLRAAGWGQREIARHLGCAHSHVARVLADGPGVDVGAIEIKARRDGAVTVRTSDRDTGAVVLAALERAGLAHSGPAAGG